MILLILNNYSHYFLFVLSKWRIKASTDLFDKPLILLIFETPKASSELQATVLDKLKIKLLINAATFSHSPQGFSFSPKVMDAVFHFVCKHSVFMYAFQLFMLMSLAR